MNVANSKVSPVAKMASVEISEAIFRKQLMPLCFLIFLTMTVVVGEECGPLGYDATDLLGTPYWYFDFNYTKFGLPSPLETSTPPKEARIYFHICSNMRYQCAGTVCLRYLDTADYVVLLGQAKTSPFIEIGNAFETDFLGDTGFCTSKQGVPVPKIVTTKLKFVCDHNTKWNKQNKSMKGRPPHGGSKAPTPVEIKFDNSKCMLSITFNYTGACNKLPEGSSPGKKMSIGSILLILFFPGLALYFIVGMLINRMAGHKGKEMVPHGQFWLALPDLIMVSSYEISADRKVLLHINCRQQLGSLRFIHDWTKGAGLR